MAKLGRYRWKASKTVETMDLERAREIPGGMVYREKHFAMRQDGKVLTKTIVGFPDLFDRDKIERRDFGWKLYPRKIKAGADKILAAEGYDVTYSAIEE